MSIFANSEDPNEMQHYAAFQMKCIIMLHFIRVHTVCKGKKSSSDKKIQVSQWATIAHHEASIMFGDTIIYDAQRQVTLNLKQ